MVGYKLIPTTPGKFAVYYADNLQKLSPPERFYMFNYWANQLELMPIK